MVMSNWNTRVGATVVPLTLGLFALAASGCHRHDRQRHAATEETTAANVGGVEGVTDDEVKLVQIASFTGPQAGLGTELYRGAMAYFLEANSRGGFYGRNVHVIPMDDKYTAEGGESGAERAINDEHPFAIFGASATEPKAGILKTLKRHDASKMFLFGSSSPAEVSREGPLAPYAFNVRGSVKGAGHAIADALAGVGFKKIAIVAQDNAFGKSCGGAARKAAEEKGLTVVAEASISSALRPDDAAKNARELVKQLRSAGAEAVVLGMTYNPASVVVRDAREMGWNVPIAAMGTPDTMMRYLVAQEKKTGRRMTNAILGCIFAPPVSATELPAVREYRDLMDKRNPRLPDDVADPNYKPLHYSASSLEGFMTARVFGEALDRAGRNLTRESFRKAVESIRDWDLGVGQKVTFGENDNQGLDYVWLPGIKGDEFVLVSDMKHYLTAKPEPVVAAAAEKPTAFAADKPALAKSVSAERK